MDILDIIFLSALMNDLCNKSEDRKPKSETKADKHSESENQVEVYISFDSISVLFNDVDTDEVEDFINFLDFHPCTYEQSENEFKISAKKDTLYAILLYLTTEYEEILLY